MTAINGSSNTVVVVAGFCINQLPTFLLSALRSTLGNILDAAVILFYFFTNSIFPYKTQKSVYKIVRFVSIHIIGIKGVETVGWRKRSCELD